jgi:cobalamin biosynthesis protein CobD/CbiB
VLVTQATIGCCFHPTDFVEVDTVTGAVAARWTLPADAHVGYRSELYEGCALFSNVAECEALATRRSELTPLFDRE